MSIYTVDGIYGECSTTDMVRSQLTRGGIASRQAEIFPYEKHHRYGKVEWSGLFVISYSFIRSDFMKVRLPPSHRSAPGLTTCDIKVPGK